MLPVSESLENLSTSCILFFPQVTSMPRPEAQTRVFPDGTVVHSFRVNLVTACPALHNMEEGQEEVTCPVNFASCESDNVRVRIYTVIYMARSLP